MTFPHGKPAKFTPLDSGATIGEATGPPDQPGRLPPRGVALSKEEAEEFTQALGQIGGGMWRQILWAARIGIPKALDLSLREWVDTRLGGYVKMAAEERRRVVADLTKPVDEGGEGLSNVETADVLGVSDMTVHRDRATNVDDDRSDRLDDAPDDSTNVDRTGLIQELAAQRRPPPPGMVPFPDRSYSCLVVDPPWPTRKIVTRHRPWQGVQLDYPTMPVADIEALPVGDLAEADAHLYLWVTHRFLPVGLRLAEAWGFRYQCLMTWNKHTGVVPFSWMYDTEHVVFATRGNLKLAKRGMRLLFDEPPVRDGHSTKPEVFYDRVRNASPEARLDMFARRDHYGFDAWGAEA
jgi:N6-adenosine-specific RNA methylase IME4